MPDRSVIRCVPLISALLVWLVAGRGAPGWAAAPALADAVTPLPVVADDGFPVPDPAVAIRVI